MTQRLQPSPADAVATYAVAALECAPRLLSLLDREPLSPTYGSFDRDHWAWKFRDFPLGMMQSAAYPLALLWTHPFAGSPYHRNPLLLQWTLGAIEHTLRRQHGNGAFDAFAPNEQDPGPTLGMLHGLLEAWRLVGGEAPPQLAQQFRAAVRKACDFAMRRNETEVHAFVSNHWALFAVAFLEAGELLGDDACRRRAEQTVTLILQEQSPDGWFNEYGGPDPGYESLGLFHLAVYWRRTGSAAALDALRRSLDFYSHCVHPDGSVGGCYGSRHTSLYFPGGFEILAPHIPAAAAVAGFMHERLRRGNVVTPAVSDGENLPSFAYTYLEAALAAAQQAKDPSRPALPCESLRGAKDFADSGLCFIGRPGYYAAVHGRRGGLCRIFDRQTGRLAYEDSGYVIASGGTQWASQFRGLGEAPVAAGSSERQCSVRFGEVRPLVPTPGRFLLLRLLNLTLFRSPALGAWLRRMIVARLILARRGGPFRLRRRFSFGSGEVRIADTLELTAPASVERVSLPRLFQGIHMGSGKYFHAAELESTQAAPLAGVVEALNARRTAQIEIRVAFAEPAAASPAAAISEEGIATR